MAGGRKALRGKGDSPRRETGVPGLRGRHHVRGRRRHGGGGVGGRAPARAGDEKRRDPPRGDARADARADQEEPRRAAGSAAQPRREAAVPGSPLGRAHRGRSSARGQLAAAARHTYFFWMLNPSSPSTFTAPLFPPSKSPEARRRPVANS